MTYPPRFAQPGTIGPATIKMPASRFSIITSLTGFEVIDYDGRTVDQHPVRERAEDICADLNAANAESSYAIRRVLSTLHLRRDTELSMYDESEDYDV